MAGPVPPTPAPPPATILPSGWTTTALNPSSPPVPVGTSVVTTPLRPKVLSGAPFAVNRSTANWVRLPPPAVFAVSPAQMMSPLLGWTVTLVSSNAPAVKPSVATPPDPKVGSRLPSGSRRATPWVPPTRMSPVPSTITRVGRLARSCPRRPGR